MTLGGRSKRRALGGLLFLLAAALTLTLADPPLLMAGESAQGGYIQGPGLQGPTLQGPTLQGPALQGPALQGPALQGPTLQGKQLNQMPAAPMVKAPVAVPPQSLPLLKRGAPSSLGQKSYSGVHMRQGRVLTDSDWNEQAAKPPARALRALDPKAHNPPVGAKALKPDVPPEAFLPPPPPAGMTKAELAEHSLGPENIQKKHIATVDYGDTPAGSPGAPASGIGLKTMQEADEQVHGGFSKGGAEKGKTKGARHKGKSWAKGKKSRAGDSSLGGFLGGMKLPPPAGVITTPIQIPTSTDDEEREKANRQYFNCREAGGSYSDCIPY